ncbi:30S ribosomal protein S7 [Candidatus Dojkabacteria bacterium]|nr:30S ribosomal protein S7 [Candidatus Dojkabacteria bacterium]
MRGKQAKKRVVMPDAKYNSVVISKFVNKMMQDGKKRIAFEIVYGAIDLLNKETNGKGLESFDKAMENIKPKMEVRSRRVGGANYQVPMPVREERQLSLAMKWIIDSSRASRKNSKIAVQLGRELISAFNKEGTAYKKKEDTHKMAEANKAFAQFTW